MEMVEGTPWFTQHHEIWKLLGYLPCQNLGIFLVELYKLTQGYVPCWFGSA